MSNNPNNPFNNTNTNNTGNIFAGNNKTATNPTGGLFGNNNPTQNTGNLLANNTAQNQSSNPFVAQQNQQPANNPPAQNNPFSTTNNPSTPLFGNKAPQNKPPGGGLFNNNQNNQAQQNNQNNPLVGNQQPVNQGTTGGIFGNNTANQQQAQGTNPIGPSGLGANLGNKPPQFPATGNIFGGNNAGNQQQNPPVQQSPANPLFGGSKPAGVNLLGQKPAENQQAGQTAQGTNPPAQNPPTTSNTGGGIFANKTTNNTTANTTNQQPAQQLAQQTTNQPATGATGAGLFANKMTTSSTVPSQQPGNNIFSNTTNPTNAQTNPTQAQNPGQQQQNPPAGQQAGNLGQGQQSGGQQTPVLGNQQQGGQQQQNNPPQVNKNPAEVQFQQKSNKTVKNYLDESRAELDQIYNDLLKCSNNLIRYQEVRQENHTIFKNFEALKPEFTNTYQNNLQILLTMENQQDEIQRSIGIIFDALRPESYDHPLISCMQDCQNLSNQIVQLQMDNDKQNQTQSTHASHEQLMLMYASLDKIQTDVDNMNELLQICFLQGQNNQNNSHEVNYRGSRYGNRYGDVEI